MNEVIRLGPFFVQYRWLIDFAGFIAGCIAIRLMMKRSEKNERRNILDMFVTAIFIPIIVWKFGPAIFHPVMIIQQPLSVLFFAGTKRYIIVGSVLAFLYVWYRSRKVNISLLRVMEFFIIGFLVYTLVSNLFIWEYGLPTSLPWGISAENKNYQYHPINVYNLVIILVIFIRFGFKKYQIGKGKILSEFLIAFGVGKMVVSYFSYQSASFLVLSSGQWLFLAFIVIGWLFPFQHRFPRNFNNRSKSG